MRRTLSIFAFITLLAGGLLPAGAACVGQDMMAELRAADPEGVDAIFESAHARPNARGLFWQIDAPGRTPTYLFGTFHTPEAVDTVPDAVWEALDDAQVAVFELTLEEQAAMQQRMATDPAFSMDLSAPPLTSGLTPEQRAVLERALAARGLPLAAAEQMRPWLLAGLLGFPACHLQAMAAGGKPLDAVMARRAAVRGIRIDGLETYEEALAGFGRIDRERLLEAILTPGRLADREEDIFRTNAALYAAGETAAINEFSIFLAERQNPSFDPRALNREVMAELLVKRNRAWMGRLLSHLEGGDAFIAVGALHLPGETGLIELLRAEGFAVTRLD